MTATANPLLGPSPLPHRLPPFGDVTTWHLREALELGMAEQRTEIADITADPQPADFTNTLEALERAGQTLHRAELPFAVPG